MIIHNLKKAFWNTSSRILFVFIDLFMVTVWVQGAGGDGLFEIHLIGIGNEAFYEPLENLVVTRKR